MKKILFIVPISCLFLSCSSGNKSSQNNLSALQGTWQLNYITGPRITFDGLYPGKKPKITFDLKKKKVVGNTSCNNFSGDVNAEEKKVSFAESMAMTKMACTGEGETVFLQMLKKINNYEVTAGYTLTLLMDDVPMMRFTRAQ